MNTQSNDPLENFLTTEECVARYGISIYEVKVACRGGKVAARRALTKRSRFWGTASTWLIHQVDTMRWDTTRIIKKRPVKDFKLLVNADQSIADNNDHNIKAIKRQQRLAEIENILTAQECADLYGITRGAVHKACKRGTIPARKSGTTWLIHRTHAKQLWGS